MATPVYMFDILTRADEKIKSIFDRLTDAPSISRIEEQGNTLYLVKRGDGLYFSYYSSMDFSGMDEAEKIRYLNSPLSRPFLVLSLCQTCLRPNPEDFMAKKDVWKESAKDPRGILCLDCLAKSVPGGNLTPDLFDMSIPLNIMRFLGSEEIYFN